jgi:hypothetical protein
LIYKNLYTLPYNHFIHEVIMRAKAGILIIIGLLFLVGMVSGHIPDTVTIISDKSYLTANNVDQSTITVWVWNTTTGSTIPITGAAVSFSVDPVYGTLTPASRITDLSGKAISTFKVKMKSGFANINVLVSASDATGSYNNVSIITQKIDHDKPNKIIFIPPYEGTVATMVSLNAAFTDQWGNPIDNQINPNETHVVSLHVHGPSPDDCYFVDVNNITLGHDLTNIPLDSNGNVPVTIRLTTVTGNNYISMEAFNLNPPPKVIRAIPGKPFYIIQEFNPDGTPPKLPSGGSFTFVYTLYDKFMNPTGGQDVWINMSSTQKLAKTTENGKISGTYEEVTTGFYTITATAVNNNSVTCSKTVQFYTGAATSHNVVANPQTMPSRDANPAIYSNISVKVVDEGGNGVNGETVYFSLSNINYNPSDVGTITPPSLSATSAVTGADGINGTATVKFYPGEFVTTGSTYRQSATGNAKVTATWNSIPKVVDVAWKNYAYLSAVLTLTPPQVKVGETVDVNLKLNGDGWNFVKLPIDVVLIIDKSGSMLWNTPTYYDAGSSNPQRITSAKNAAKTFVTAMDDPNNRVGLVSFASTTSTDRTLTTDFTGVKSSINGLTATGATQMRRALYEGITDVDANGRNGAVKAVILLTDGDWNYDGSILGHGTGWTSGHYTFSGNTLEPDNYRYYSGLGCTLSGDSCTNGEGTSQNMSIYAKENNVRIYALSFVNEPSATVKNALNVMTNNTGGFYEHAPDEDALNDLYEKIANDLGDIAGVDTTADMDFGTLNVDGTSTVGSTVFEYVGDPIIPGNPPATPPGSTMVDKYNKSLTHFIPGPDFTQNGPLIINQTNEWNANKSLNFNIGLVKLNETWETNFRLRVLKEGTIMLFSPESAVHFQDYQGVESSLPLGNLSYLTAVKQPTGLEIQTIEVVPNCPLNVTSSNPVLPFEWDTIYNGNATTIFEEGRYMSESGAWVLFHSSSYNVSGIGVLNDIRHRSTTFDLRRVAPGKYTINIKAYTSGSRATSSPTCGPYLYNTTGIEFIQLK